MIFIIMGVSVLILCIFLGLRSFNVQIVLLGLYGMLMCLLAGLVCNSMINKIAPPIITESSERYSIEYMDKDIVRIEGVEYSYEVRYDKNAEESYVVIAEVEASMLYELTSFKIPEEIAYVYTNNVVIFSEVKD